MRKWILVVCLFFLFSSTGWVAADGYKPGDQVDDRTRCPVCGMFVAKYEQWLAQVVMTDGKSLSFDGVKDMMAYYFSPGQFGSPADLSGSKIYVKDYYRQNWIDGRKAFYVIGSDVYGPMGHELIPFEQRDGAENFLKDHHGRQIFAFDEISAEMIEALRKGHKMKGMN